MLSNSNPKNINKKDDFFDQIYKGFRIEEIDAKRMINSNAKKRGAISEIVVMNYEIKNRLIKEYDDGEKLEYGKGKFDSWCVYYTTKKGNVYAPKDQYYFEKLKELANKYTNKKVYEDFTKIYDKTGNEIEEEVLKQIETIASTYSPQDCLWVDKIFSIVYMAMISEQKKENAILGKRIKRLGIYLYLMEAKTMDESTKALNKVNYKTLQERCKARGF